MKWPKRLGISLTIAFFAVCCGAVLLFNWGSFGFKALSVPTGSMRPTIAPSSLVLMHRVPLSSIKTGDVITYANPLNPKATITHRVIKSFKLDGRVPAFYTKGDANPTRDQITVIGGQVLGKAVWHVPHVGGWLSWGKGWPGIITLVYIPALIIIAEEVIKLNKALKQAKPYKAAQLALMQRLKPKKSHRLAQATTISVALVAGSALLAFPAEAMLRSNTVTLGPNHLTVAAITPPPTQCTTNSNSTTITINGNSNSNNHVSVNNSTSQSASSGNASVTGNTNGGSATSGSASNTNTNCVNITITNH